VSTEAASPPAAVHTAEGTGRRLKQVTVVMIVLGALLSVAALPDQGDRARLGFGYLWGFLFLWAVVLGSLFFVGLQHITRSVWSVVVRRVAEMIAAPMWILALLFVPVAVFVLLPGQFPVFPWADHAIASQDHLIHEKHAYLNVPFFLVRGAMFFALWIGFSFYFVRNSLKQDRGDDGGRTSSAMRKASAPFIMLFAVTATFAGIDWLMSLNPHWFSTIFGVYVFAGMVVSSLAAIVIAVVVMRTAGIIGEDVVTDEHLYSLGALQFAFVCFWAYIAFSQYMLIWYANIPEETFYLHHRLEGSWLGVSVALALVRFALPFLILLPRRSKMNPGILFGVSILLLLGQLLDLYWLIMPELHHEGPVLGWQELGPTLLISGLMILYLVGFVRRNSALAVGDPLLGESRKFRL
jgi:hypothetical protein